MAPQFSAVQSFVDASFFGQLAKYKLDTAKLSEETVAVHGSMTMPVAADRRASLVLSHGSLGPRATSEHPNSAEVEVSGSITNYNTLEDFKALDKAALLRNLADSLKASIESGAVFEDMTQLLQFHVISFSDLKKYKFYYWFAFPALGWLAEVQGTSAVDPALHADIVSWRTTNPHIFFDLSDDAPSSFKPIAYDKEAKVGMVSFTTERGGYPWGLRNFAALLGQMGYETARVYVIQDHPSQKPGSSYWLTLKLNPNLATEKVQGWERTSQGRLMPKVSDLSTLLNPNDLANQAVDLNLKLMKWRAAPDIDLHAVRDCKCLLLGAGTLGSYIARGLMAWGVRHITFVDNGKVSYSNPVRQPLYVLEDCVEAAPKAEAAAAALREIFPGVTTRGLNLNVPMAGHPVTNEQQEKADYEQLVQEIEDHDAVFLLMDSRESRWLPTVICSALKKRVINVAIGFDSYVVMRHGVNSEGSRSSLGCYFCNDVVAPIDSVSRLTLDQMCTVARPGIAQLASAYAVELLATVLQHAGPGDISANSETVLGPAYHQLRGFLRLHETKLIWGPSFLQCSACGPTVLEAWHADKWDFVRRALDDSEYLSTLSGLADLQQQTADLEFDSDDGLV